MSPIVGTRLEVMVHQRVDDLERKMLCCHPEWKMICTSHAERTNLSVRLFNRRFTRLTLGYSKEARQPQTRRCFDGGSFQLLPEAQRTRPNARDGGRADRSCLDGWRIAGRLNRDFFQFKKSSQLSVNVGLEVGTQSAKLLGYESLLYGEKLTHPDNGIVMKSGCLELWVTR